MAAMAADLRQVAPALVSDACQRFSVPVPHLSLCHRYKNGDQVQGVGEDGATTMIPCGVLCSEGLGGDPRQGRGITQPGFHDPHATLAGGRCVTRSSGWSWVAALPDDLP